MGQPGCLCLHYIKRTNDGAPLPDSSAIFQRMKKGLCTNAYFSLTRQPHFFQSSKSGKNPFHLFFRLFFMGIPCALCRRGIQKLAQQRLSGSSAPEWKSRAVPSKNKSSFFFSIWRLAHIEKFLHRYCHSKLHESSVAPFFVKNRLKTIYMPDRPRIHPPWKRLPTARAYSVPVPPRR